MPAAPRDPQDPAEARHQELLAALQEVLAVLRENGERQATVAAELRRLPGDRR